MAAMPSFFEPTPSNFQNHHNFLKCFDAFSKTFWYLCWFPTSKILTRVPCPVVEESMFQGILEVESNEWFLILGFGILTLLSELFLTGSAGFQIDQFQNHFLIDFENKIWFASEQNSRFDEIFPCRNYVSVYKGPECKQQNLSFENILHSEP